MSVMCCVFVPEGIVLAADSRLTNTKKEIKEIPETETAPKTTVVVQTRYTSSDNAQKVMLIQKSNVGISFCWNATIDGLTVADYIRRFEIEKVLLQDTTENIANALADYSNGKGAHFFVCGYDNDVPYVFDVCEGKVKRFNVKTAIVSDKVTVEDIIDEQKEDAVEIGVPEHTRKQIEEPAEIDLANQEVRYSASWAGQMTAITKIVNNKPTLNVSWNTMPLKDAIDFAEFLVDTTIKYERFCNDIQTCGGDIDILVITKDEAFWKQHKIYNPKK